MCKMSLLCGAALIASVAVGIAAGGTPESAVPNFASADFGWQLTTGLDFRPIEGKIAPVGPDPSDSPGRGVERMSDADNPNLKPWAAAQMRMHNDLVRNGHRAFSAQSRCWPGGGTGQLLFVAEPFFSFKRRKRSGSSGSGTNRCAVSISTASTAKIQSRLGSANPSATTKTVSLSSTPSVSSSTRIVLWTITARRTPRTSTWLNAGGLSMAETRSKRP